MIKIDLLKEVNVIDGNNTDSIELAHQLHFYINKRLPAPVNPREITMDFFLKRKKIKTYLVNPTEVYENYIFPRINSTEKDLSLLKQASNFNEFCDQFSIMGFYHEITKGFFIKKTPSYFSLSYLKYLEVKTKGFTMEKALSAKDLIDGAICFFIANYGIVKSYFFPVERSSMYTFAHELGQNKLEIFDKIQSGDKNIKFKIDEVFERRKIYPKAINDSLRTAQDLLNLSGSYKSEFYSYAEHIEERILKGKVKIDDVGEVFFIEQGKSPQPFHATKSSFKNLASIVVFLKYQARKNDLMIIEEPEAGLDEKSVVTLTSIFNELLKKGLKLFIVTNSSYIKKELKSLN